jgi:hypothetical protein
MFSNTEITFKVGVEIDVDEIEGVEKIIKFLQEIIDKARERETKRLSLKKIEMIEKKFDEVMESAAKEIETETVKQDGSIDCECGSNVILRNTNRHKRTKKHIDWALAHSQL